MLTVGFGAYTMVAQEVPFLGVVLSLAMKGATGSWAKLSSARTKAIAMQNLQRRMLPLEGLAFVVGGIPLGRSIVLNDDFAERTSNVRDAALAMLAKGP